MITVDKGKLKFLKAGRAVQVDVDREYRKGRAYKVRLEGSRTTKLPCVIVDSFRMNDGCWRLTIRQHVEEEQWFLAANPAGQRGDYTHDPHRAARGEPEAVDPRVVEKWAERAGGRDDLERRAQAHAARVARRG